MVRNFYQLNREEEAATFMLSFEDSTHDAAVAEFCRMFCPDGYEITQRTDNASLIKSADGSEFICVDEETLPE